MRQTDVSVDRIRQRSPCRFRSVSREGGARTSRTVMHDPCLPLCIIVLEVSEPIGEAGRMSTLDWWDDGSKTSIWAMKMLPILVRQAGSQRPLTYGAMAKEVGMTHHRPVQRAAGHIAYALEEIAGLRGWRRRPPPKLQSLIINKATGLPGHGVNGFMSHQYQQARTKQQRAAALLTAHAEIYAYPHWSDVMRLLGVETSLPKLQELTREATDSRGRGGEGPDHKALKDHVAANPVIVGLPAAHALGTKEHRLPSGDQIDVLFMGDAGAMAVEVKSHTSGRDDVARGIYQCVKYRAVLEAQSSISDEPYDVSVMLVLGGPVPHEALQLANAFGVPIKDEVIPG